MTSMFDYDDSINLSFDAKIAGKSLVAAKHEVLTKTGDFLFLAHSERELAQRMQMVEEDIEKTAYRKLANLSDSKAKLVRVLHEEWQLRHANCEMCKVALQMPASGGAAPAPTGPGADIGKAIGDVSKGVAKGFGAAAVSPLHGMGDATKAVGNAVGDAMPIGGGVVKNISKVMGDRQNNSADTIDKGVKSVGSFADSAARGIGNAIDTGAKAVGNAVTKLPGQVGDAAKSVVKSIGNVFSSKNFDDRYENEKLRLAAPDAAKEDYDKDGKLESGAEEHAGAVDRAIQKQNGQDTDDN